MRTRHTLSAPSVLRLKPFLRRGLPLALLCAAGAGSLPIAAHAQQTRFVPVLSGLPVAGRMFVLRQDAPVPVVLPPKASDAPVPVVLPANAPVMPSGGVLVSIDAKSASLATLVDLLMEQAHASYTLSQKLTNAPIGNVKLRRVPLRVALDAILNMSEVPVMYRVENGIYRIMPKVETDGAGAHAAAPTGLRGGGSDSPEVYIPKVYVEINTVGPGVGGGVADPVFTISARDVSLYDALRELFGKSHMSLSVTDMTRHNLVTIDLHDQPLRDVVDALIKASGQAFSYRVVNGVYDIYYKQPTPEDVNRLR